LWDEENKLRFIGEFDLQEFWLIVNY